MSQKHLNNGSSSHRDYGAISSSTANMMGSSNNTTSMPDVNFSGFSPTEFMSLSEDIGKNIQAVNSSSRQLDKILKILGTARDQQSIRDEVQDIFAQTKSPIEITSIDLERLKAIVPRGDKQQKLQLDKLTNDFRTVVESYTAKQKRIATAMRQTYTQAQLAQMQDQDNNTDSEELLQTQLQLGQQQLQFEHDMLVERERQIKQIEADILDVNVIMRKIYLTGQAQGEEVASIETNIENAATEIELGREELAKAAGQRQSYRRKILILLAIAVIIGLIVTGIIVIKLTS